MAISRVEPRTRFDSLLQLAGLSLFLATIEMVIPKPMPFLKLGITNLPILLFVRQLQFRELLLLVFLKVFCQSLLSGSLISYIVIFSICSSLASGSAMWLLARSSQKYFSLLGISILGAASSNGVQLLLALSYFFPGTGSLLIPWSLSFGLMSGIFLGLFALQFVRSSLWYQEMLSRFHNLKELQATIAPRISQDKLEQNLPKNEWTHEIDSTRENFALRCFIFGLFSLGLMFAIEKYEPIYLVLELLLFLWLNKQRGYHLWWRSMLMLLAVLVFFHLLLPSGQLLWEINIPPYIDFKLTQGALERGIGKAFFLLNLIQISRFTVSCELRLPGRFGQIVQIVFSYYEGFFNTPIKFSGTKPFVSLDSILCSTKNNLRSAERVHSDFQAKTWLKTQYWGYVLLTLIMLLQVGFLLLGKFFPLYRLLEL